jgi:hypothetical protein
MDIDFLKIIAESEKYPHLKVLFDVTVDTSSDLLRLKEFVRIMLDLKHHSIVKEFLDIYDTIVGEIVKVEFINVKKPSDRFSIIESIFKKVEKYICRINDYFINTYDMKDDALEIGRLFRVTAYCFLAELHNFNENEFYCDAFEFPVIDKKLSTNKILYEKRTGMKISSDDL